MRVRVSFIAVILPALFACRVAWAQVGEQFDGTATPTPMINATSPLGVATGGAGSPTGLPFGSTEITSPGVSPLPTGTTGTITIPSTMSNTACSTVATSPIEMFGSRASFDGGGMMVGTSAPATAATSGGTTGMSASSATTADPGLLPISGMSTNLAMGSVGVSGMCGAGSSGMALTPSTPASTAPTTSGGNPRTGIPMGSWEIANLGVSSAPAIPTLGVLPTVGTPAMAPPPVPVLASALPPSTTSGCTTFGSIGVSRKIVPTEVT